MPTHPRILVVDDSGSLAQRVRAAAAGLGGRVEVVACANLHDPLATPPFSVIVAGGGLDTREGIAELEAFHDRHPWASVVLAYPRQPRVGLRQVVRVGAVDLVSATAGDDSWHGVLARALSLASPAGTEAGGASPRRGTVITVASATGGCGKTFYAVNAAYFLHRHTGLRACIIDLDLQFGEVTTALRLRPQYTIFDARRQREDGDDGDLRDHLEEYLVEHSTGIHVLPAPLDPTEADRIDPPDVLRVIEAARSRFDYVVVDTPPALTEVVLAALDVSEVLYVLATLDLPSVRNLSVFLSTLDKLRIPTDAVRLIMNKAEANVGLQVDEIARMFTGGFSSVLPYAKEVSRSVNQGIPVLAGFPQAEVSRQLAAGLLELLPDEARAQAELAVPAASRRRLFGRRRAARAAAAAVEAGPDAPALSGAGVGYPFGRPYPPAPAAGSYQPAGAAGGPYQPAGAPGSYQPAGAPGSYQPAGAVGQYQPAGATAGQYQPSAMPAGGSYSSTRPDPNRPIPVAAAATDLPGGIR